MKYLFFVITSAILWVGCNQKPHQAITTTPLTYTMDTLSDSIGRCDTNGLGCAHVVFIMPHFAGIGDSFLHAQALQMIGFGYYEDSGIHSDLKVLMRQYLLAYDTFKRENGDNTSSWEDDRTVAVVKHQDPYITLSMSNYNFSGGAHPNSFVSYRHFNIQTHQEEKIADWLLTDSYPKLVAISEKVFRQNFQLAPDSSLDAAGFFFAQGIFVLPAHYTLDKDTINFFYNDYELHCHAAGPYTLSIPYQMIAPMIKPNSYLGLVAGVASK